MSSWRPGEQLGWRKLAIAEIPDICEPSWPRRYDDRIPDIASFVVSRIEGQMTRGGSLMWAECRTDCEISFERIPLSQITVRDPSRVDTAEDGYPVLEDLLRRVPSYDSVPIVCARAGGQVAVWDGHHRLRTYELAGRPDIPSIVARFVTGDGQVRIRRP